MTIGIVGLGLIGGSLAKAYKKAGAAVFGYDIDGSIQEFAGISGAIDGVLTSEKLISCDLIMIAVSPKSAAVWLDKNAGFISKSALVMDCCGTKRRICEVGFQLAVKFGFEFAGGHPMAGTHRRGFKNSSENMFKGACMVVVPRTFEDIDLLERIKRAVMPAGFASVSVTTAEKHDKLIAFTSQLAHIVSNAYIKSPTALEHKGFSAGSYQDLTRVAWLNPGMWTELFYENKDNLLNEMDIIIASLNEYRNALASDDTDTMCRLLDEGRKKKEEVDGK
ncbi:MAG: prephenate dehydrogenase [Oscillospiraceae bacterium]|nr:prephenate dehydrogenase [Oscillospiraceae bacterium]